MSHKDEKTEPQEEVFEDEKENLRTLLLEDAAKVSGRTEADVEALEKIIAYQERREKREIEMRKIMREADTYIAGVQYEAGVKRQMVADIGGTITWTTFWIAMATAGIMKTRAHCDVSIARLTNR